WYSTWWASLTSGTAIVFTPSPSSVYDYTMTTAARTYTPASTVFNLTGDDAVASITPPFQLPLYGQKYSSMWVDTNGRISVQNNPPWNGAGFDVFHDDLLVDGSAAIRTSTTGTAPNRVADVASYQYGLDTNPPTTIVNAGSVGGSANVTITPSTDGVHTLYVRSVDRAGNLSPIKSYGVYVGYGAVTSPTVGTISAGKVTLSSVMNAYSSGITYQ